MVLGTYPLSRCSSEQPYDSDYDSYDEFSVSEDDEVAQSFENQVYLIDHLCPEIRAFDRNRLRPCGFDFTYNQQYNQVLKELKSATPKLKRVKPLSWTRWVRNVVFSEPTWSPPKYG